MYQRHTTNRSFIDTSEEFKELGIINHEFMLHLIDRDLAYISPFAVHPKDFDTQHKVIAEAIANPWYFVRECTRILQPGMDPISFTLNRDRATVLWSLFEGYSTVTVHPRQSGANIIGLINSMWRLLSGTRTPIHRDSRYTTSNYIRQQLKNMVSMLPKYIQPYIFADRAIYSYSTVSRRGNTISKPVPLVNRSFVVVSDAVFQNDLKTTLDAIAKYRNNILPTIQQYIHTTGKLFESEADFKRQVDALFHNTRKFEYTMLDQQPFSSRMSQLLRVDMFTDAEYPIEDYAHRRNLSVPEVLTDMYGQFLIK